MLTIEEIKQFINEDANSEKKKQAKIGERYYNSEHDILQYRIFYYNADGELVEDTSRNNAKIPHPFLTELNDQATQYILSVKDGKLIMSDIPELQTELDAYFNENEDFNAELSEVLTGGQNKGFEYMYAYKNEEDRTAFQCADSIGVVEVEGRFASDKQPHIIYWYVDRIDKKGKQVKRIMDWTSDEVAYYVQIEDGKIVLEKDKKPNPQPHILYQQEGKDKIFHDSFKFIPFFRFDANKKQVSSLKPIKPLIDDYDIMASALTNNLVDFDKPIYVVKGFGGEIKELEQNIKTKKMMGIPDSEGNTGLDIITVNIPYEARKVKLELDEKNIYRFGMGLNMEGLKDTSATTNIAIKAMYALLDLKCSKLKIKLKQFLRKIIKVVLDEINKTQGKNYQMKDVYFNLDDPDIISNAQENAQIELTEAQRKQAEITTLLNLATHLDNETLMQLICEQLDIDYDDIKGKLPDPDEAENAILSAQTALDEVGEDDAEMG